METKKIIAKKELEAIGGTPKVFRYWDDNERNYIDVLSSVDSPCRGVISYATIGMSECEIGLFSNDKSLRVELLGACDATEEFFANILATTAFEAMQTGKCSYGDIIPNVISEYIPDLEMKHIYLTNPFLWEGFETFEFMDRFVAWLLIVPISDEEKHYAVKNGGEALEDKFEEQNINIFNLKRKSVFAKSGEEI